MKYIGKNEKGLSVFKKLDKIFLEFRLLLASKDPGRKGLIKSS